jgi:hypothetical protein
MNAAILREIPFLAPLTLLVWMMLNKKQITFKYFSVSSAFKQNKQVT